MTTSFWILLAVFISRLYFVIRRDASTAFLAATGVGVLGLFFAGALIPVTQIDSYLGSINFWHLLRNLCVTAAVWLIRDGIRKAHDLPKTRSHHPAVFLGIVMAIVAPFLCQDFVFSTSRFIPENVTQWPVLVYATVYMGALAGLAFSVIRTSSQIKDSLPVLTSSLFVAAGMASIVLACLDEMTFMVMRFASLGSPDQQEFFYQAFPIVFYTGVGIVAAGLGVPPVVRLYRRLLVWGIWDRTILLLLKLGRWGRFPQSRRHPAVEHTVGPNLSQQVYEQVIRARDLEVESSSSDSPWLSRVAVKAAQVRFQNTPGPARAELPIESSPLTTDALPATSEPEKPLLERVARLATEIAQPPLVLSLLLVLASLKDSLSSAYAGIVAALFMCLIPWLAVVVLARRGRLSDHHVGDRKQRRPVMLWTLGSSLLACGLLLLIGAPPQVWAVIVGILGGIAVLILVSPLWKISGHALTLGGAAASSVFIFGWLGFPFVVAAPLVCWSRVYLKDHSGAQVTTGFATGIVVFTCSYILVTA